VRSRSFALAVAVPLVAPLCGCASLATSPEWTGGGLATLAPVRAAEDEAAETREQERLAHQPKQVGAKHILVMHAKSKDKPENVTRTREQARKRAQECLTKVRAGGDWDKLVHEYSDEPGSDERHGDLGVFGRGQMVRAFTEAAFSLRVHEVSEIVETPYGFHIIERTE